jgi:hypothetical protein
MTDVDNDSHLELVGRELRAQAAAHSGDLRALLQRAHEGRRRRLAAAAAVSVFAIVAVLGFGGFLTERGTEVQTDIGGDPTVTSVVAPTSSPGVSPWTVNPKVGALTGEIWVAEIVFDPGMGGLMALTQDIPLSFDRPTGFAEDDPGGIAQVYWTGPNAKTAAESVRDFLTGRRGIVSVAVARAVNGSPPASPSGTTPGTTPSGRGISVWPVPASLGMTPGDIWAVEVAYDPARWDERRLTSELPGSAVSIVSEEAPRARAFWNGPDAFSKAMAAQQRLEALPGVVTAELGRGRVSIPPGR